MQAETRVGSLNSVHGGGATAVDSGAGRRFAHHQQQQRPSQQALHQQPQIGTWPHLLAGGIAGAVSKTCTAPLARLTILFQVQGMHSDVSALSKASIWREASRIVCEEGVRAFWRGNLVTIAHRLPYSSISFYAYERYKLRLCCCRFVSSVIRWWLGGITAASMTYPLDLVRTRLAAQTNSIYYRGITHALYAICRDEGVRGLYKGLGATLLGVGPSIAISFSVYEKLRSVWQLERPSDNVALVSLACGSLSGIASSTVTFPLDLVRRRMQLEGGLFAAFRDIVQSEGLRGLYRGILPEYYKVVPSVGIVFLTYESLKSFLAGVASDE
ncbi:unnamed protein product [Spirodela intermedia]|uniref:Uncharacterized protein n=1 Tax=Spirodela intermedia TaxID=51605 RepID=A0A7I8JI57_SPIIN|nr:unnamed protein product [Spirodela intermedia]CAA6669425.1 unnamed protein product [Spirodela intermedia]